MCTVLAHYFILFCLLYSNLPRLAAFTWEGLDKPQRHLGIKPCSLGLTVPNESRLIPCSDLPPDWGTPVLFEMFGLQTQINLASMVGVIVPITGGYQAHGSPEPRMKCNSFKMEILRSSLRKTI